MKTQLFQSATLRLTAWYMAILIILSLLFSGIVYSIASREFERAIGPGHRRPGEMQIFIESDMVNEMRRQRIEESRSRLVGTLLMFNIFTLGLGGGASYLLARRTLQPIEDALEAQSQFSSDAAHELRTPLTIMQSEIEVELRDKKATKSTRTDVLESNLEEVQRLRTMTDRLLLLAGSQDLPLTTVDLDEVAVDVVNRMIPLAQAKRITIDNRVTPAKVLANSESLADTLAILLDNAIKYSPQQSVVTLTIQVKDKAVMLSVADEGLGLSAEDREKIFDRFYRADTARSAQHVEGHGLGLSIAKRVMELMRGDISVQSSAKGSVFTLTIPRSTS